MAGERATPHILSISYDQALLRTREMLLQREGYLVSSALGFTDGVERCKNGNFDLFILGHSIPINDKRELVRIFRAQGGTRVLALERAGDSAPDGADAHADPFDIQRLLDLVGKLLKQDKPAKNS